MVYSKAQRQDDRATTGEWRDAPAGRDKVSAGPWRARRAKDSDWRGGPIVCSLQRRREGCDCVVVALVMAGGAAFGKGRKPGERGLTPTLPGEHLNQFAAGARTDG